MSPSHPFKSPHVKNGIINEEESSEWVWLGRRGENPRATMNDSIDDALELRGLAMTTSVKYKPTLPTNDSTPDLEERNILATKVPPGDKISVEIFKAESSS